MAVIGLALSLTAPGYVPAIFSLFENAGGRLLVAVLFHRMINVFWAPFPIAGVELGLCYLRLNFIYQTSWP